MIFPEFKDINDVARLDRVITHRTDLGFLDRRACDGTTLHALDFAIGKSRDKYSPISVFAVECCNFAHCFVFRN